MRNLKRIIDECVRRVLYEAGNISYRDTATPLVMQRRTGHAKGLDDTSDPSSKDFTGEALGGKTEHLFVSDNKFMIYKIKNFGNTEINGTMQFFGNTVEYRRAFDTVNGAANRGGKGVCWRTITPESAKSMAQRNGFMSKSFWEFSFDGQEWYILKPNPVQTLKISKFK